MKILVGLLILVTSGIAAQAQGQAEKVITELSASTEKIVKNSPFSAEAVSESVQTLMDGNRIVHSSTTKLYRNSEGRFRREISNGSGGLAGTIYSYGSAITILDPVVGFRYTLDPNQMTARQMIFRPTPDIKIKTDLTEAQKEKINNQLKVAGATPIKVQGDLTDAQKEVIAAKIRTEVTTSGGASTIIATPSAPRVLTGTSIGGGIAMPRTKYETRKEELGVQNIEGVEAEGTRTITTIPAGAIGNERPIEIVYERWYSKELQLVVMSKNIDPRSGEQTYRLTNIVRSEPDPSLFTMPSGYKLRTEPSGAYRIESTKVEVEKAASVKPAATPKPVDKPKPE